MEPYTRRIEQVMVSSINISQGIFFKRFIASKLVRENVSPNKWLRLRQMDWKIVPLLAYQEIITWDQILNVTLSRTYPYIWKFYGTKNDCINRNVDTIYIISTKKYPVQYNQCSNT